MTLQANHYQTTTSPLTNARDERRRTLALAGGTGYVSANDFKVSAVSGQLAVDVAACDEGGGLVWAPGRFTHRGAYFLYNDAAQRVTLNPADASQARTDLIVVTMHDGEYEGDVTFTFAIDKVTGTPGGGVPATTGDTFVLAQVPVAAGATSCGTITDRRTLAPFTHLAIRLEATQLAGQTMANGAILMSFTAISPATGWGTAPTTTLTVPAGGAGLYEGMVKVEWNAGVASANRVIGSLKVNGVSTDSSLCLPPVASGGAATRFAIPVSIRLAAGDTLQVECNHTATSASVTGSLRLTRVGK